MNNKQKKDFKKDEETAGNNLKAVLEEMEGNTNKDMNIQDAVDEKQEQYENIANQFQRLQADFANYKRRVEKQKSDIYLYANEKIASDLLDIIDNLERALESQPDNSGENCLLEGVELVLKQLTEMLDKHGIKEIEALGKQFDMNLHHAIMQEETEGEANCVMEVLQKGYTINNKILRPSMVKVSK